MRSRKGISAVVAALGVLTVFLIIGCAKPVPKKAAVDYEALAEKLVNQCAGVREGDCVWINGGVQNVELLEDLAVQVRKAGAFPLTIFGTDRMDRRLIMDVPEKWDSQQPVVIQKVLEMITVALSVDYREKMDLFADIPAKRLAAMNQAYASVLSLYEKRKIRDVSLGNGLYPTANRAKQFGVPVDTLSKLFWDGVNVDYNRLRTNCGAVKNVLAHGKEIRVIHTNGTDLTFGIANRTLFVSDGIIPTEDPKKKSKVLPFVSLPAGEVYSTPVPGTARGKVVIQTQFYMGKEIKGLTLTFDKGKLLSMTAESGIEPMMELYNAAPTGKELFAYIDFGTNPSVHIPVGSRMKAYMAAGMVTVAIGNNSLFGGENGLNFGLDFSLSGSTVTVDGKVLVENGALKI